MGEQKGGGIRTKELRMRRRELRIAKMVYFSAIGIFPWKTTPFKVIDTDYFITLAKSSSLSRLKNWTINPLISYNSSPLRIPFPE
jgi:hypothetical protein